MRAQLNTAAEHFALTLNGEPTFGWYDRTIGSRAISADGQRWLRVSWSQAQWIEDNFWTGNQDAATIIGVPKPTVIDMHEWGEQTYRNRAEVMTLVTEEVCSQSQELRTELNLSQQWWLDLRSALDTLSTHESDPIITRWTIAHGDLNWSNLTAPRLMILDWESFGAAPAGYDAATLYVLSLLKPETARMVHENFADVLDSPDGIRSQLHVITRYLKRIEHGDFADLADPLHQHARRLVDNA